MFGKLFNTKDSEQPEEPSQALLQLRGFLLTLADSLVLLERSLDGEVTKLKKMFQIGSPLEELQTQVGRIQQLARATLTEYHDDDLSWFKALPAQQFIQAVLSADLPKTIQTQLNNYQFGLSKDVLAPAVVVDLLDLFQQDTESDATVTAPSLTADPQQIRSVVTHIVKLLRSLDGQTPETVNEISDMISRADSISNLDQLQDYIDNVSNLILNSINSATGQFENFLISLKKRLEKVGEFIKRNDATHEALAACSNHLSENMNAQVGELRDSLHDSKNLEELEQHVSRRLEFIIANLDDFNKERNNLESEAKKQAEQLRKQLEAARSETENLRDNLMQQRNRALTDSLTHLPNRHAYNERLHLEYNRWRRYKTPLSLVVCDLDLFKAINDTYGHSAGDYALEATAQSLQKGLRQTDFIARFGGEEFVILLPETNLKDAVRAMNKLRINIQRTTLQHNDNSFSITVSFGVATFEPNDDFTMVFNRADTALYRAKNRGRNQVCAELKKPA